MRYKYTFEKNVKDDVLTVFEAGEIDNDFDVMYEGTYSLKDMADASREGAEQFIVKLRKINFFPDIRIATKLYGETIEFFSKKAEEKIVIDYEDVESLDDQDIEDDDIEVDDLLSDDGDTSEDDLKEIDIEDDAPRFMPDDISEHED